MSGMGGSGGDKEGNLTEDGWTEYNSQSVLGTPGVEDLSVN